MKAANKFFLVFFSLTVVLLLVSCMPQTNSTGEAADGNETKQVSVYFLNEANYAIGVEPYEVAVYRTIPASENEAEALLRLLFEGPTEDEYASGIRVVLSDCTGFSSIEVKEGVARVYLTGDCASHGATYTIASLIFVNLKQLDQIEYVKIFNEKGETGSPEGFSDSMPESLEP